MTSFVHVDYPTQHPGVIRAERVATSLSATIRNFDGARAGATLLLSAVVSALLVVANQVIDSWSDGHLLAAWIVLWAVAFASLALLARPVRTLARDAMTSLAYWRNLRRQARDEAWLWEVARGDHRVVAEIRSAMSRD